MLHERKPVPLYKCSAENSDIIFSTKSKKVHFSNNLGMSARMQTENKFRQLSNLNT